MHADSGQSITGLDHLHQSISKIVTTPIGSRIARRDFGTELVNLIDAPNNRLTHLHLYAAIATSLMRWEPRLTLTRVSLVMLTDETNIGKQAIDIEGVVTASGAPLSARIPLLKSGISSTVRTI